MAGMEGINGVIISTRYTAYQIKLKLHGGREVTLWKRKFAGQWGGSRNCETELQQALCDTDGDSCVPVLAAGVAVALTRDAGNDIGKASIFCVLSVSAPSTSEEDAGRMQAYTSAIAAWVSAASRNLLSKAELLLVPSLIKVILQRPRGIYDINACELSPDRGSEEVTSQTDLSASDVVRDAISLIRGALSRVNIRATLEQDTRDMVECRDVSNAELDTLTVSMDDYESFRRNPFEAHMGGSKRPQFRTLDTFAQAYGLSRAVRGVAAVAHKLKTILADGGHACCSSADLIASPLLDWTCEDVRQSILDGVRSRALIVDGLTGDDVYLTHIHRIEVSVGSRIAKLSQGGYVEAWAHRTTVPSEHNNAVRDFMQQDELCLQLDAVQRGAVLTSLTSPRDMLILSGYPGTGKSRVSQAIRRICEAMGLSVIVCAPTAKAASRLGEGAMTVHRTLGAIPNKETGAATRGTGFKFAHNETTPLDADLVLVDEVSMLDMNIAHALLRACDPTRTRLILVGDANQLPSVEWGDLLGSLMESSSVPRVFLEHIYRQDTGANTIWPLAKSIASGGPLLRSDLRSETVTWTTDESLSGVAPALLALRAEYGDRLQIISPSRRHGLHTGLLNEAILNRPPGRWDMRFEVGDRVVVIKNQPQQSQKYNAKGKGKGKDNGKTRDDRVILDMVALMNGDCGAVTKVSGAAGAPADAKRVSIRLDDGRTGAVCPSDLEHAYALTTHKAQGSEYDVVAVVMSQQQGRALNRQALYTSVSRAVQRLYIYASRETLITCVSNVSERRMGHLRERIDVHHAVIGCEAPIEL